MRICDRIGLVILLLCPAILGSATSAYAGCSDFTDGSIDTKPPRVEICFRGECEITVLTVECGNVSTAFHRYANGFTVSRDFEGRRTVVERRSRIIPQRDWKQLTCREIDEGGCFGDLKQ